jgi:hypothetical protein
VPRRLQRLDGIEIIGSSDRDHRHVVPLTGGRGLSGLAKASYNSELLSQKVFTGSGAQYTLEIVKGAGHKVDDIDAAIQKLEGWTISEKAAAFFGLKK